MVLSNLKSRTHMIFALITLILIVYIVVYAYNASTDKTNNLINSNVSMECISHICVEYDEVKECIHVHDPTLFKIDKTIDNNYLNSSIKVIDFSAIKEGCK
jgi:hypothetical protein